MPNLDAWSPKVLSLLRIVAALLFLQHGMQKVLDFPAKLPPPPMAAAAAAVHNAVAPHAPTLMMTLGGFSGYIELVAGILLVIGLFSRLAAFIASGEMAFAYFMAHFPRSPYPINNGGDLAVLFCFVFLFLVFAGAGPISLDAALRKKA
jgi:putative oxidoreductase